MHAKALYTRRSGPATQAARIIWLASAGTRVLPVLGFVFRPLVAIHLEWIALGPRWRLSHPCANGLGCWENVFQGDGHDVPNPAAHDRRRGLTDCRGLWWFL